jgi:asparaginyl-tRNA synthetase
MSPYHVDETAGSDTSGNGTADAPYQSLAFALFTHGQDAKLLVRKDAEASFEEPTQSALKKAKKNAEGIEKKRKKAEELAARDADAKAAEREKQEKRLEESKKINLTEDPSLPKAVKVRFHMINFLHLQNL